MAIRDIVTGGFGNGTFNGTIPLVVTRGYLSGSSPVVITTGIGVTSNRRPPDVRSDREPADRTSNRRPADIRSDKG